MQPIAISTSKRFAYVVTLFGGDGYVPGALVVAHAFHRLGDVQQADLICLVTADVPMEARRLLALFYHQVVPIDYLIFTRPIHPSVLQARPYYAKVWTKLQALRLTSYEKICLIDADYLPYRSMLSVFDYEAPAAVSEVPTGIDLQSIDLSRDRTYSPEWSDLFKSCCRQGADIPGIILLVLLYSNNLDVEVGRYSTSPKFTGNFYYGGMNASVMLLEPNIFEFRDIIQDLTTYSDERLKFFYPEQQYLTLRYAFGRGLTAERIPEINQEFLEFVQPYFEVFYAKMKTFKNILSKQPLSFCDRTSLCPNRTDRLLETADIVQMVTNILAYYITTDHKNTKIGPWTSLGLDFFITEYYSNLPPTEGWLGFPLLQQQKLWTRPGIDLIQVGEASMGYPEWFDEFRQLLITLGEMPLDPYAEEKRQAWLELLRYYDEVASK